LDNMATGALERARGIRAARGQLQKTGLREKSTDEKRPSKRLRGGNVKTSFGPHGTNQNYQNGTSKKSYFQRHAPRVGKNQKIVKEQDGKNVAEKSSGRQKLSSDCGKKGLSVRAGGRLR